METFFSFNLIIITLGIMIVIKTGDIIYKAISGKK